MSLPIVKFRKIHNAFDFSDAHLFRFNYRSSDAATEQEQLALVRRRAWNAMIFLQEEGLTAARVVGDFDAWSADFVLSEHALTDVGHVFVYYHVSHRVAHSYYNQ